ncbi:NLR family CARD domain-containing protein 4 [Holothuria leucospilota]|uniref:NLR family CARD domain-containing protein 4 n=1 Tax=Holothuria leucospilota TaxID=206669 RepID=A0A9Q1CTC5_HOLLE|nr:NLR family CARD domain-containing protein 4 [Holothuria leucospilota]
MPWNVVILLCFVCASPYFQGTYSSPVCSSPQPIELQKRATIRCSFEKGLRSVFWYDTTDITVQDPILSLRNGVPSGSGYWSGEFNVTSDGSLIIQNVSLAHNHYFSVTIVYQPTDKLVPYNILAVVVVKPKTPFPVISACGNERVCLYQSSDVISMECQVEDTRPAIPLEWVMKTSSGDVNASYELTVKNDNVSSISRATTKDMKFNSFTLRLLSCKARDPYSVLRKADSFVLVENTDWNNFPIKESEKYIESTSSLELTCTGDLGGYYVWKSKKINRAHLETLSFGFSLGENFTKGLIEGYEYSPTGSLYVRNVRLEDEQSYFCLYGDGSSDKIISYNVFVYILPVPKVLQVSGCINYSSCSLLVDRDGNLTCIVTGVRPKIELAWRTYNQHLSSMITFNDHQRTESNGQTYDISLTSTYHVEISTLDNLTVECAIIGKHEELFSLSTKVTLYFRSDESRPHERDKDTTGMEPWKIVIIIVAVIFISVCVFGMIFYKGFYRRGTTYCKNTDEEISNEAVPLSKSTTTPEEDLKNGFIDELKQMYKAQYNSIKPVPIKDNRFQSVRNLFVEGTIEKLPLTNKSMETESDLSTYLGSYDDIFYYKNTASNRYILDGDPGTGKSFLTLKMASDWVKSIQTSYLGKVEILILLRLRQLKMGITLYKSIKQFILPRESKLSEENIKAILDSCGNVVMLLDGFDEYHDHDRDATSDLMSLIKGEMYSNFKVIVTTRTSTLPKMIHPRTIRLRLIGFDDEARNEYIRKAVKEDNVDGCLGNPEEAVEKIKRQLSENPILDDLCRIPLFFAIFVHVTHDKDISKQLSSVTSFFRCAISCFHEHMKMKLHPSEAMQYEILENNHQELDRVAFEALSGNNHHIVWYRKDLIQYLGKDCMNNVQMWVS